MGFAKFNICNPCCEKCFADYNAYTCPSGGFTFFPLYEKLWPSYTNINNSGMKAYIVRCTGYNNIDCQCAGTGQQISETFHIFRNPVDSGKHRFYFKNDGESMYAIVTEDENNQIYRTQQSLYEVPSCSPTCSGSINAVLVPTGWVGGNPCWWSNDYANFPFSIEYDLTAIQDSRRKLDGNVLYWCPLPGPCNYSICYGPGNPPCNTLGTQVSFPHTPDILNFNLNKIYTSPLFPFLQDYASDLQLEYIWLMYTPQFSYIPCNLSGPPFTLEDGAIVRFSYLTSTTPTLTCNTSNIQIKGAVSDLVPKPTGYTSLLSYNTSEARFFGPTALSDANDYINQLPFILPVDSGSVNISSPGLIFSTGPPDNENPSYSCPGFLELIRLYNDNGGGTCLGVITSGYLSVRLTQ